VIILIDGSCLVPDMKGVGLYLYNILQRIPHINGFRLYVTHISNNVYRNMPSHENITYIPVKWVNHWFYAYFAMPILAYKLNANVIWFPSDLPHLKMGKATVMSCHGVNMRIRRAHNEAGVETRTLKGTLTQALDEILWRKSLHGSHAVLVNSRYVAHWLESKVELPTSKLRYAPCAPALNSKDIHKARSPRESILRLYSSREGYILVFYTGALEENLQHVLKVYDNVLKARVPHNLLIAGVKSAQKAHILKLVSPYPWRDRVRIAPFLGPDSRSELAELYSSASIYIDFSLEEGFGMQVVEAMACATPVVCSNRGALPEVTGGAALLVSPRNVEDCSAAIVRTLADPQLREELVRLGTAQAAMFTWERTTQIVLDTLIDATRHI